MDELVATPLLASYLEDTVVFTDSLDKLLTFVDSKGHRLFKVDILSGLASSYGNYGMLMVRSCNYDSIDIGAGQKIIVILVHIDFDLLLSLPFVVIGDSPNEAVPLDVIDVAACDNADIIHRDEPIEKIHRLLAEAYESEIHFRKGRGLLRGLRSSCGKDCSGDHSPGDAQCGRLQKVSSLHSVMWFTDNIPRQGRDHTREVSRCRRWTDP